MQQVVAERKERGVLNPFAGKQHSEKNKQIFRENALRQIAKGNFKRLDCNNYTNWFSKYGKEEADRLYEEWLKKLSSATAGSNNPMFGRPSPQGSGNGWSGWYDGNYFRSLRELAYMVTLNEQGKSWRTAEDKVLGIPYVDWGNKNRTYFADFLVEESVLVEVKPRRLHNTPIVIAKRLAAEAFCEEQGWKYELIDCDLLPMDRIRMLRIDGSIKFTERYEAKFMEEYGDGEDG